jgi:hypothetical protein
VSQKYATIGFNYVGLNDIRVSRTYGVDYSNNIFTSTADIKLLDKDNFKINLVGEGGTSNRNYLIYAKDTTTKDTAEVAKDYFIDGGMKVKFKKLISFKASYKNVGINYSQLCLVKYCQTLPIDNNYYSIGLHKKRYTIELYQPP